MTTLTTTTATAADILRKAADLIRSNGLAKGGMGRGVDGSLCSGHAISDACLALRASKSVGDEAWLTFAEQVSGVPESEGEHLSVFKAVACVVVFNDAPETTQERVIKEFEAAAEAVQEL